MRKWIVLGLVAIVAFVGWQAASPWMAMDTLRDAAREGDRETLEQNIDFPALRESAKAELHERIDLESDGADSGGVVGVLGANFAKGFADGIVDALVTPKGISAMLVTGKLVPLRAESEGQEIDWHVRWTGFSSFRAEPETKEGRLQPSLIFERDGLGWKLAGVDIPDA